MIISASRRTDLPAFYGRWFMNRIEEGYFYRINPFNPKQINGFSLDPADVDVIVFWTKNPKPFVQYLDKLDQKGYNYYFQFTLNNYPETFEPNVPDINERIETFIALSGRLGRERVIWRYDPIIISSITNEDYHAQNIEYIASRLAGYTKRLIFSYLDFYGKVKKRITLLNKNNGIKVVDAADEKYLNKVNDLSKRIKSITEKHGLEVYTCGESIELGQLGIEHGSCIDGKLISKLFGIDKYFNRDKNQRQECLCSESVDVGVYNTCKFKCTYCYANYSDAAIENNIKRHVITSASMIGEYRTDIEIIKEKKSVPNKGRQLSLFDL